MKYLLILLIYSWSAYPSIKILAPNKPLPIEFSLMLESIQLNQLTPSEILKFENTVFELDSYFELLSKDEIFFLCKSEIYKAILKRFKNRNTAPKNLNSSFIKDVEVKITLSEEKFKNVPRFNLWIVKAMLTDYKKLMMDPKNFNFISLLKSGAKTGDRAFSIWEKKVKMVGPWLEFYLESEQEEFDTSLKLLKSEILSIILGYSKILVEQSRVNIPIVKIRKDYASLTYFKILELKEKDVKAPELKVEESEESKESINSIKPEWTPKESPGIDISGNLPDGYPTPNPSYKPPEKLPEPVNDWIQEI